MNLSGFVIGKVLMQGRLITFEIKNWWKPSWDGQLKKKSCL